MLTPDTILQNRYRIVRELGHGGMGTVYEAVDQRVNCIVALKETLTADNADARRAFEREASLLANLRHSALPKVMDYFAESGGEFLVMEYIEGRDLAHMLDERGAPFPQPQVMKWAFQLLDVLEYLHSQEPPILHRDIKPSNLKLTKKGDVVLLDFGLAKGSLGQMPTVVTSRSVRGYTPVYASLEQIHGIGTDVRSDIYSLGATLYHLLTGVAPVDAPSRFQASEDGIADPLPEIGSLNPEVAPAVASTILQAMAISRKHRPASAEVLKKALLNAVKDENPAHVATQELAATVVKADARDAKGSVAQTTIGTSASSAVSPVSVPAPTESPDTPRASVGLPNTVPAFPQTDRNAPAYPTSHTMVESPPVPALRPRVAKRRYVLWIILIISVGLSLLATVVLGANYFWRKARIASLDPAVKLAEAKRLSSLVEPLNSSEENLAKAQRAIAKYQEIYHSGGGPEVDYEVFRGITRIYENIRSDDQLIQWVSQYASSAEASQHRAEAYTYLAAKQWQCAYTITWANSYADETKSGELHYRKPQNAYDLSQLENCTQEGFRFIEEALSLDSSLAITWKYLSETELEIAKLSEMEGKANEAQYHRAKAADADKRATDLKKTQAQDPDPLVEEPDPYALQRLGQEAKPAQ